MYSMGAVLLTAYVNRDLKTSGTGFVLCSGIAVTDAVISSRQEGKDVGKHLYILPVLVGVMQVSRTLSTFVHVPNNVLHAQRNGTQIPSSVHTVN